MLRRKSNSPHATPTGRLAVHAPRPARSEAVSPRAPSRPRLAPSLALLASLAPARVFAFEAGHLGEEPVRVDVTESLSVLYNFDNRDTQAGDVTTRANDDWALVYQRLNLQGTWGAWQAGLRLDGAWFPVSPDPTQIGLDLVAARPRPLPPGATPDPLFFRSTVDAAGLELSNRFQNWTYPAKWWLGWQSRHLELWVGDVQAAFGRGYVLAVRKQDELSSDTSVRGARATLRGGSGDQRLGFTVLGGSLNPLRLDEASGRWLYAGRDVRPGWLAVTEAGMPHAVATDFAPEGPCASFATCTYAPDRIAAAQLTVGLPGFTLGTQGSALFRQEALSPGPSRSADRVLTASQSVDVPALGPLGAVYLEAAVQDQRDDGRPTVKSREGTSLGHALLLATSTHAGPVTVLLEGKHHRRFFPLAANVDLGRAREFSTLQYSAPPTTEAIWIDTALNDFNTCVSGGRARVDLEAAREASVFAWVGRWSTWAESVSNAGCDVLRRHENRVWDVAVGAELVRPRRGARASLVMGGRLDTTAVPRAVGPGERDDLFYREVSARYDVITPLAGPLSLQLQGVHRRRQEPDTSPAPWSEGQHLTGVDHAPSRLGAAFGVEYSTRDGVPGTYFNGQATFKPSSTWTVGAFVGQRRGALRCVGGVCRVYPAFEGARLDVTARF